MKKYLNHSFFRMVSEIVSRENTEAWVIGGFVRDVLLGRPSKDIDIVVVGSGIELAHKVATAIGHGSHVTVFSNFGTAMVKVGDMDVEFVGSRKESYRRDSRKPIVEGGSLEDDQRRRDFTINTMALGLRDKEFGRFLDPFGGLSDLKMKLIRTPLDPLVTFDDDPLRMVRALRFASQLGFHLHPGVLAAIKEKKERLSIVSSERITDELNKIILSPAPSKGFLLLERSGLLELILPEMARLQGVEVIGKKHHKDNFLHTIKVLDNVSKKSDNLWLRWAAILHDIAKPVTRKFDPVEGWSFHAHDYIGSKMVPEIFRRLRLPLNDRMKYVQKLVRLHLRPMGLGEEDITDSAIRRLLFEAGDDIDDLMSLCEADITSKHKDIIKMHLDHFGIVRQKLKEIEEKDAIRNFQPPIGGEEIIRVFGIKPGREVGLIKDAIKDAILDGKIGNNHEEAYRYMLEKARELGLTPVIPD